MIKCSVCSSSNTDDSSFCRNCGSPLEADYTCGNCGHSNSEGSKFCTNCGQPLTAGAGVAVPSVATPVEEDVILEEDDEELGESSLFPWKPILFGAVGAVVIMAVALAVVLLRTPQDQVASVGGGVTQSTSSNVPTYLGEVKAILDVKCIFCHSDEGLVPQTKNGIPLLMERYRGAFLLKNMIMEQVVSGKMPVTFNHEKNTYEGAAPLSPDEIQTIVRWVRGGAPE